MWVRRLRVAVNAARTALGPLYVLVNRREHLEDPEEHVSRNANTAATFAGGFTNNVSSNVAKAGNDAVEITAPRPKRIG
jgi:hypothetical protein